MNVNQYSDVNNKLFDLHSFNEQYPTVNRDNVYDVSIQTTTEFEGRHENNIEKLLSVTPKAYTTYVFIDNSENYVNACLHEDNFPIKECDRNEMHQLDDIQYTLSESADLKLATNLRTTKADESFDTMHSQSSNIELEAETVSFRNDKAPLNHWSKICNETDIKRLNNSLDRFTAYNVFDADIKFEDEILIRPTEPHYLEKLHDSTNGHQDIRSTEGNYTQLLLLDKQVTSSNFNSESLENKLNKQGDHPTERILNVNSAADLSTCHKTLECQQNIDIGKIEHESTFDINSELTSKTVQVDYEKFKRNLNKKLKAVLKKPNSLIKKNTCDSELTSKNTNSLIENKTCDSELSNLTVSQQNVMNAEKTHIAKSSDKNKDSHIYKFVCDYCKKRYKYKNSLKLHIIAKELSHISGGLFQCELCKKTFEKYKRLYDHVVNLHAHSDNQCSVCQKTFRCKKYLRQHIARVHVKENIANLDTNDALKFHCEFCPKTFKAKDNLNQHINNIHKSGASICYICGSVLKCKPYLLNHLRRVHYNDGQAHICECGKVFRSPRYLSIHKKNMNHFNEPMTARRPFGKYINKSIFANSNSAAKPYVLTNDCLSLPKIDDTNILMNNNYTDVLLRKVNNKPDIPAQHEPSIAPKDVENSQNLVFGDKSPSSAETVSANKSKYMVYITKGPKDTKITEKSGKPDENVSGNNTDSASLVTSFDYCNKEPASGSKENVNEWSIHFENSVKKSKKILRRLKKSAKKPCIDTSIDWCIDSAKILLL